MTKRMGRMLIACGVVLVVAGGAWAQAVKPKPRAASGASRAPAMTTPSISAAVAVVGGLPIPRAAFEQRAKAAEETYRARSGTIPPEALAIMRRQVLEGMIREKLLLLESRRRGMTLSQQQAEEEIKKDPFFFTGGSFDEAKFLAIKAGQPERFRNALLELQNTIPAIQLKERLQREAVPDTSALRGQLASELSTVKIDFLALHAVDFGEDRPEPTEAQVLAYYRDHANDFRQPDRAVVSVLTVNQPPLAQELQANEAARKAWDARMERSADSLLAAIKRGAPIEGVASLYGGLRSETVERNRFPRYWADTRSSREAVFSSPAGTVLEESYAAASGRMLVRVDARQPAHVAPLREVSAKIRGDLRSAASAGAEDRELRALYTALRDSLKGDAYRIRYAVADTATIAVPMPTQAELDRYYRGHQADYATLDRATTSVVTLPFSEVRDDVQRRLLHDRRVQAARTTSDRILRAWMEGRRDARLEKLMSVTRDVGPIPVGGVVDTGIVARALSDSLANRRTPESGIFNVPNGLVVYQAYQRVTDFVPPFETSRSLLSRHREDRRKTTEETEAKAFFEEHPDRFRGGNVVVFSRLMVSPPAVFDVPLERVEVENWYRNNRQKFGAPELVRVRHILISPKGDGSRSEAAAREEADDVMKRLRNGEDFATLALRHSDDDATKRSGGDLGVFRPGMMLPDFEREAFTMTQGELRGPIRTSVGYDILQCLLHVPGEMVPLKYCYANVAVDAARSKAKLIARFRADSLLRTIHSVAQARTVAKRSGYTIFQNDHVIGTLMPSADIGAYVRRVEKLKAGDVYPEIQEYVGMGYAVTWVDSILPPRHATWLESHDEAITALRREKVRGRVQAKRAELDSLVRSGWSVDSVAALWNGPEEHGPIGPGHSLAGMGGATTLDSLAFGAAGRGPVLKPGTWTDWIELPQGIARMRLAERSPADPVVLATRFESDYQTALERNFRSVFDKMRHRFPVQILDPELKLVNLPSLEAS